MACGSSGSMTSTRSSSSPTRRSVRAVSSSPHLSLEGSHDSDFGQHQLTCSLAKRAYLSLLLSPPPIFLPPASIRPYDRPDAAQIIQSLAARTMGHRSAVSSALTSGSITSLPTFNAAHGRTMSTSNTGMMNGFVMPKPPAPKNATARTPNGTPQRIEVHNRTGSASSSWGRQAGAGVLNFSMPSSSAPRLPTHSESSGIASRSSSTSELGDPIGAEENDTSAWNSATPRGSGPGAGTGQKIRRESVSADKALREVQKALASVEAQG